MDKKEIEAIIILLRSTLGGMQSNSADSVVRGVIALLENRLS